MLTETIIIILIVLFIIVLAFVARLYWPKITGGNRIVAITNLFELPTKIEYQDDVTGTTMTYDTKLDKYMAPETNEQIRTVARIGSTADYGRLIQLVGKFYRGSTWEIPRLLNRKDDDIYNELRRRFPRDSVNSARRAHNHAYCIYRILKRFVDKPKTLLDIGCNTGGITAQLGKLLNVEAYGIDVIEKSHPDIKYTKSVDGKFPYPDASMDVVTANMTLHHIDDLSTTIREIQRVLRVGGILFIKEHDCWSTVDAMLIDIEHLLYDRVGGDVGEYKLHHYTNYYGWDEKMRGLEYVDADYFYLNLKNEMSATRAFWTVYRRPATPGSAKKITLKTTLKKNNAAGKKK